MSSSSDVFPHLTVNAAGLDCMLMHLRCAQVGARGYDEWGAMFASSMKRCMVGIGKMRIQQGPTGFTLSIAIVCLAYLHLMSDVSSSVAFLTDVMTALHCYPSLLSILAA